jgi:hypothetical protein
LDKIFCQALFLYLLPMSFSNYNAIQNVALDSQQFLVCFILIASDLSFTTDCSQAT